MSAQLDLIPRIEPTRKRRMQNARARADHGIERSAASAENAHEGWCDSACDALRRFVSGQHGLFTIELARAAIESQIPPPPDLRAWGAATRQAVRRQIIERVPGMYFAAASSNGSEKPCYRRGPKA